MVDPAADGQRQGLWRPTRTAVIVAMALVVAAAAALVLGSEVSGTRAGAASGSAAKGTGSASVARRDLIETDTQSGTLSYADSRTVYNRLSGTITSLAAAGAIVRPGGVLFTVDNAPVVLMDGTLPAYRTLSELVADGPDIKELEQNLVALGYDPGHAITVDDHFDSATTAAVDRWQAALGQTQTGAVALGQVVFLPGQRRVATVSASLGSTGGGGAASTGSATGARLNLPAGGTGRAEFVDLTTVSTSSTTPPRGATTTSTTTTQSSTSTSPSGPTGANQTPTLLALIALLRAEIAELKAAKGVTGSGSSTARSGTGAANSTGGGSASGARAAASGSGGASSGASPSGASGAGSSASSGSGAATAAAQAVLTTTSTQLVATVQLDATKQTEAVPGAPVTVQMPDGSTVDGRISRVAAAAQVSASSSGSGATGAAGGSSSATSTVPVTITLRGRRSTAGLDQAAVSVNFQQQKALGVLSVPVTALLATAGGGYAIQEVAAPHQLIPVTPGLFAAGFVQISGGGVSAGLAVTDSQG